MEIIWGQKDDLKAFLKEVAAHPLLKPAEEIALGRQVKELRLFKEFCEDCITPEKKAEYARQKQITPKELESIIRRGQKAKERMITGNLRLVISIAKKFRNRNVELLDLIQEGVLGLEKAVERFDPDKGFKFSTFSYWWIRQSITRLTASNSRALKLPVHIAGKVAKLERLTLDAEVEKGQAPSLKELAKDLEISIPRLHEIMKCSKPCTSLDGCLQDGDVSLGNLIEGKNEDPIDLLSSAEEVEVITSVIEGLPVQEKAIFVLRWGLSGEKPMSATKTSEALNVSRDFVRDREGSVMRKIRKKLAIVV